ncbi:MAG TPA: fused MFS/spermidine synthase [Burkholderiaceae bacterium]|nr:fused MFS/spermidine synthase [Burkholderiaceae bacterium]HMY98515.1 fused MFS/spermidine synthase [Burkholderiaceae bacterium]HNB43164.1 fused MFS/spermidine synthase [Burkholderiaceae bacterium]HNG78194.1 fused MFS/spermidine synthase [Burkholderiaceae bacterium]
MTLNKASQALGRLLRYVRSPNRQIQDLRRVFCRRHVRCVQRSAINGEVKVVERGRERLLLLDNRCHSFGMTHGSDAELYREYWGHLHRTPFAVAPQPRVLMCGLGGGTGLKVLAKELQPRSITVIELDPVIIDVAQRHFDVERIPGLQILAGDAQQRAQELGARAERFDLVVEDAMCLPTMADAAAAMAQLQRLAALLAPGGSLVLNAPIVSRERDTARVAAFTARLRELGMTVDTTDAGQRWWFNRMVYAQPRSGRVAQAA